MPKHPGVAPLQRRRLVDDAAQSLRNAILGGHLPAGTRLRQEELAARLGISRTPIREALVRLQQEGLLEIVGTGVRVVALDFHEAAQLYDIREVLDGLAARLAAGHADAAALGRLGKSLDRMSQCVRRRDANQWFPAHVAFHDEIFRASGNRRLQGLGSLVRLSIRHFHPLLLTTRHRLADAYAEHRAIYEALVAHDAPEAERLARAHIATAKEIVLKQMTQAGRDGAVQA